MMIAQTNDKFFSMLLSKEEKSSSSPANKAPDESSFRFFSSESSKSSVPFRWESRPGTPKHPLSAASLPPLTPPPSHHSPAASARRPDSPGAFVARSSSLPGKFLRRIPLSFPRRCSSKKANNVVAPSSCSSSFSLPPPTPPAGSTGRRKGSWSEFRMKVEEVCGEGGGEKQSSSDGGGVGPGGKSPKSLHASRSWLCFNKL